MKICEYTVSWEYELTWKVYEERGFKMLNKNKNLIYTFKKLNVYKLSFLLENCSMPI